MAQIFSRSSPVEKAHTLAAEAHADQERLSGAPYLSHAEEVARIAVRIFGDYQTTEETELTTITALLHDAPEHSTNPGKYLQFLLTQGVESEVITALNCLTRNDDIDGQGTREGYFDYIERLGTNTLARRAKIADIMHNLADPIPQNALVQKGGEAIAKTTYIYGAALQILWDAELAYQASQTASSMPIQAA